MKRPVILTTTGNYPVTKYKNTIAGMKLNYFNKVYENWQGPEYVNTMVQNTMRVITVRMIIVLNAG